MEFVLAGTWFLFWVAVVITLSCLDKEEKENVLLFRTKDRKKYHSFLEDFDGTKYEIIDIQSKQESDKFYIVTYRKKTK